MNIRELDQYNLGDAVKFNKELNPRLWEHDRMRPEVRAKLLQIAQEFKEFLGVGDLNVRDITVSGSNAAYTYTPHSDIDLHLVVDLPQADSDEVYRELFDAKKYAFNDMHDITIGGYDVELYVENANTAPVSKGMYSILNNAWVHIPRYRRNTVDDAAVRSKYEDLAHRIDAAIDSGDLDAINAMTDKLKHLRRAGLDQHGELGSENLAYKILRTQGYIRRLYAAKMAVRDQELSLPEQKQVVKYGYAAESPDGVSPRTKEVVEEERPAPSTQDIIHDFISYCVQHLELTNLPRIKLRRDPEWSVRNKTFGRYTDQANTLEVGIHGRHVMDILRTVAHELVHRRQHETQQVPPDAGGTGSAQENEANARAGIMMRNYAAEHPEYFEPGGVAEGWRDNVKKKVGAAALATGMATVPGCATTDLAQVRDIGRTAQSAGAITRAGVRDELRQELNNYGRAVGRGDAGSQNLSRLYQLQKQSQQPKNESSGYIPTRQQAQDPRFVMALTQDVRPGATGREANKLNLKTNAQGQPALLMSTTNRSTTESRTASGSKSVTALAQSLKHPRAHAAIDYVMTGIAKKNSITPAELHDQFVDQYKATPDDWIKKLKQELAEHIGEKVTGKAVKEIPQKIALGGCFRWAFKFQKEHPDGVLVQAKVSNPWHPQPYHHAWVEWDGHAYDWQSMSGNLRKPLTIGDFREFYSVSNEHQYNKDTATALAVKNKHYGPWDKEIKESWAVSETPNAQRMVEVDEPEQLSGPDMPDVAAPAAVTPHAGEGVTGKALASYGISRDQRRDQQFVDSQLGTNKYTAGSAASNLALLANAKKAPTPPVSNPNPSQDQPAPKPIKTQVATDDNGNHSITTPDGKSFVVGPGGTPAPTPASGLTPAPRPAVTPTPAPRPAVTPVTVPPDTVTSSNGVPVTDSQGRPVTAPDTVSSYAGKVSGVESGGSYTRPNASGSSAYGRYQFMPTTFAGLVDKAKPGDELYGKKWEDFKTTPGLQDAAMSALTKENETALTRAKLPVTDGNRYLMHFMGPQAITALQSSSDTPLSTIYPLQGVRYYKDGKATGETGPHPFWKQNPNFKPGQTTGDIQAWANNKMKPTQVASRNKAVAEGLSPATIHHLADRQGIKWDNEPSFLKLTKKITGKSHLDDLTQTELKMMKTHMQNMVKNA